MKRYNVQWKGTMCIENVQCAMKFGVQWEIWCAMKNMVCNEKHGIPCNVKFGVQWDIWNKLCFGRCLIWHREGYWYQNYFLKGPSTKRKLQNTHFGKNWKIVHILTLRRIPETQHPHDTHSPQPGSAQSRKSHREFKRQFWQSHF